MTDLNVGDKCLIISNKGIVRHHFKKYSIVEIKREKILLTYTASNRSLTQGVCPEDLLKFNEILEILYGE